jgi:hypothetical protein
MVLSLIRLGIVALVALACAGCNFTASPAEGLRFAAPAGWRPSPGILGFMQLWQSPNDDQQILMLIKSPHEVAPDEFLSNDKYGNTLRDTTVDRRQSIVICGHQSAEYVEATGTSNRGARNRLEVIATNVAGTSYFAMYARPLSAAPDAKAAAALRTVCAKS